MALTGRIILPGEGDGPLLKMAAALSFWGGVDPDTGRVTDVRHPDCGRSIAGTVLAMRATRGSSSSSAVMLELIRGGRAPAALILVQADAIIALGVVIAREMGWAAPPVVAVDAATFDRLTPGRWSVGRDGRLTPAGAAGDGNAP